MKGKVSMWGSNDNYRDDIKSIEKENKLLKDFIRKVGNTDNWSLFGTWVLGDLKEDCKKLLNKLDKE